MEYATCDRTNWTNKSAVVRLSFLMPMSLAIAPALAGQVHWSVSLPMAFTLIGAAIGWAGFVVWQVTMNAHLKGNLFGDTES